MWWRRPRRLTPEQIRDVIATVAADQIVDGLYGDLTLERDAEIVDGLVEDVMARLPPAPGPMAIFEATEDELRSRATVLHGRHLTLPCGP